MQVISFRGLTISGTCSANASPYHYTIPMPGITGLGINDVKSNAHDRLDRHGVIAGPDYLSERSIGIPVIIHHRDDPKTAMQALTNLKSKWGPGGANDILSVTIDGIGPSDDTLRYWGRPRNAVDVDLQFLYTGTINLILSFVALDPIGYGPEQSASLSSGANTVTNPGSAPTDRAIITLRGDGGIPKITNNSRGDRMIAWRSVLGSGVTRIIDLRHQTVTDSSGQDKFSEISPTSHWFDLREGSNTLTLDNVTTGNSITYRGGWW